MGENKYSFNTGAAQFPLITLLPQVSFFNLQKYDIDLLLK